MDFESLRYIDVGSSIIRASLFQSVISVLLVQTMIHIVPHTISPIMVLFLIGNFGDVIELLVVISQNFEYVCKEENT